MKVSLFVAYPTLLGKAIYDKVDMANFMMTNNYAPKHLFLHSKFLGAVGRIQYSSHFTFKKIIIFNVYYVMCYLELCFVYVQNNII